ncbi:MAG: peptidase M13 [Ignavibacteriales bacterium CG12_big_fil_rev_8_21_14_0_65_30_8]|nr:MAG: peptidase M13 [Ignavibacteriales bacterium CG12_big_fil_rev_8_21_14_0_65_30_8]
MNKILQKLSVGLIIISITSFISLQCTSPDNENHGFDLNQMDTTANPAQDFYQYSVGNWVKNNPIPDEYSYWGSFTILAEENYKVLKEILEKSANDKSAQKGSNVQKIGDFYATGMDSVMIEKLGIKPIEDDLKNIASINSIDNLISTIAWGHKLNGSPVFNIYADIDAKNSTQHIATLSQSGLGLPDRDYYTKTDKNSVETRAKYVEYVTKMFKLLGYTERDAKNNAKSVMNIETRLAKASMTRVERRDPNKTYNKMSLKEIKKLAPNLEWDNYFSDLGFGTPSYFNVEQPEFFKEVNKMVKQVPIKDWRVYLTWNFIDGVSTYLNSDFDNANFEFFGKYLRGSKVQSARWKRVMRTINRYLGEALGQLYVEKTFPPEAKQRASKIVDNLKAAMKNRIENLDWMSDVTKKQALHKLDAFGVKIGYPDKWKDYSTLEINRDSYIGNVLKGSMFAFKRNMEKLGKPIDKTEWGMTPQTVNAYYNPTRNEIVFPAAILQPPFFNQKADDAINYGAMGAVIGHEITHGFDDQGRKFDADGNLKDWWTKDDGERFEKRAQKIFDQFDSYYPIDSLHINGKLTAGENIADLGGLTVAYTAFKNTDQYKKNIKLDGFTPSQRFFFGWAQVWENNIRVQSLRLRIQTDPHSPGKYRVLGPLSNMPEFWNAFNVKPGDNMRMPEDKVVKIW